MEGQKKTSEKRDYKSQRIVGLSSQIFFRDFLLPFSFHPPLSVRYDLTIQNTNDFFFSQLLNKAPWLVLIKLLKVKVLGGYIFFCPLPHILNKKPQGARPRLQVYHKEKLLKILVGSSILIVDLICKAKLINNFDGHLRRIWKGLFIQKL